LNESDPPRFVELAKAALDLDPTSIWAADALGSAYDLVGNHQLAIKVTEDAHTRTPGIGENAFVLANLIRNSMDLPSPRVLALLQEAEQDEYYRPYARAFRGFYMIEMGDTENGEKLLESTKTEYPYLGLTDIFFARHYLKHLHNFEAAKRQYISAISKNLVDAVFYNIAAWDLLTASEKHEDIIFAKQLSITAVALSKRKDPNLLDTLAEAHFRLGASKRAVEIETEALALNPPNRKYYEDQLTKFQAPQ
jgi:tetratricopeptide (TPR) repeat protein